MMPVPTARRHRPAARRVLLALPAAVLLAAAGCATDADDEPAGDKTVTATVTPPVETSELPPEGRRDNVERDERAAGDGVDQSDCATALSGQEVAGQNIVGTVQVRTGQTCVLSDLTVTGGIDVRSGGRLEARDVRVTDDIEAEGHAFLQVSGGEVAGSIELERGGEAIVENVRIDGDLESEGNSGPQRFEGNTIGGDLECQDNARSPTGGGNQVGGDRAGQCADL